MANKNIKHNLLELALKGAIAAGTLSPDHFGLTTKGRYAPRWFSEAGLNEFFTLEEAEQSLTIDAVKKRVLAVSSIDEMVSVVGRVKGVMSDLDKMKEEWDGTTLQPEAGGGVPGEKRAVVRQARKGRGSQSEAGTQASVEQKGA